VFLKQQAPGILGSESIKWNFTKFLVDRNGKVVDRFASKTKPMELTDRVEELLGEQ
jgi:glutathione peroxidase